MIIAQLKKFHEQQNFGGANRGETGKETVCNLAAIALE